MSTGVYTKTAGDVIRESLRAANISGISLPVEASDFAEGSNALNDILAWLQTKQIHLWSETEAVLPINPDQQSYSLPGAHCFTDYAYTTISADFVATDTAFTCASTEDFTVGDFVGIELSDGTRWWDTIATIPDSTSFTTDTGATGAGSDGATVYVYTDKIDQPVRILDLRYADDETASEIPTSQLTRQGYFEQPSKDATGAVNSWYYSRQLTTGKLYFWPVANDCNNLARFTFIKPQYIPENQSDNILIPPEWYLPIKHKLSAELGVTYAISSEKQVILEAKAKEFFDDALGSDNEMSSFQFHPEDC